jgi:hypothetical protein
MGNDASGASACVDLATHWKHSINPDFPGPVLVSFPLATRHTSVALLLPSSMYATETEYTRD